jgi:hypothetical protein
MTEDNNFDDEDEPEPAPAPEPRAPAWLAVVRIICVLGMSFCIAFGVFLLLFPSWLGIISLLCAIPFFVFMRYVETHTRPETD